MNSFWEHESNPKIKFTPAKSRRQRFSSPVNPRIACRWFTLVSPYHRCWPDDGEVASSDTLRASGDHVLTLFRCLVVLAGSEVSHSAGSQFEKEESVARLLGQQTISPQELTYQVLRCPRCNVFHSDLYAIATRLATSATQHQDLATPDPSRPCLCKVAIDNVEFHVGDMMDLHLGPASMEAVTVSYGLRNCPDLHRALREIYRVLKPGGVLASLDFVR